MSAVADDGVNYGAEQFHTVMFWNVENLFDPTDDPKKEDDEFTPTGTRHWTSYRQYVKMMNISRVIEDVGKTGGLPSLIGFAEVENDSVMHRLLYGTPLLKYGYQYVMTHSADVRGIDVALVFHPSDFRLIGSESLVVPVSEGMRPTRDILHAWGKVIGGDTLDVIVVHLPSRLGGARHSRPQRQAAHQMLRHINDSLVSVRYSPHVIIMGDMNDTPSTRQLRRDMRFGETMINLMQPLDKEMRLGRIPYASHKYQGEWAWLDQFWINKDGFSAEKSMWLNNPHSISLPYMLVEDVTHLGHRPLRTYYGYGYEGGFSDHLPITIELHINY